MLTAWLTGVAAPADIVAVLLLALAIDAVVGDPPWLYRVLPHPVALIGWLVATGDSWLNEAAAPDRIKVWRGALLTAGVTLVAALAGGIVMLLLTGLAGGWLVEGLLASTLIAFRGLYDHAAAVARGLESSLEEGHAAVSHIVGRQLDGLDETAVARATVESLAENFSDGVAAPVFWFLLLGLPGLCAYKAVNTLDSMIAHRNLRYIAFGRVAARLDDMVNWLPARLAAGLVVLAALVLPGASGSTAWHIIRRDAQRHRSPNAGWLEAAFAGALDFCLAGPRRYEGQWVQDAWMGDGRIDLEPADIRAALKLYLAVNAALAVIVAILWLIVR